MSGLSLAQALRYGGASAIYPLPPCLAFVGAGGKTTAMFELSHALVAGGYGSGAVFVTTTTHLGIEQARLADRHLRIDKPSQLPADIPTGVTLFTGQEVADGRLVGLNEEILILLKEKAGSENVPLLIEADGSRLKPLKAPAEHEPAIPGFVDAVVVVAGLSVLRRPLLGEWVHRPERFAELAGLQQGDQITSQALIKVLTHPLGGLKGIPVQARVILLLTQADTVELQAAGKEIAEQCLEVYQSVIVTSLTPDPSPKGRGEDTINPSTSSEGRGGDTITAGTSSERRGENAPFSPYSSPFVSSVFEPASIILLAAGASSRFGRPKQVIDWRGKPLVRHMAELALSSGCSLVRVVVGAYSEPVSRALDGLPVEVVENQGWREGQAASVRAGIRGLPDRVNSALFLLVDQPQVPLELLQGLFDLHAQTLSPLTAPTCQGRRANPVLFDRVTFPDLLTLKGDMGGRALFANPEKYPVAWLHWEDERLLWDVDTEEDLSKLSSSLPHIPSSC
jgi:molybdenum cofactor cytidylyltransferase